MGIKTNNIDKTCTKYKFYRKAGRSIIERKPIFSPDGDSLLVIVENVVRVYNIKTGDCARTLETESLVKELVTIEFPDHENYNLYGCSDKGCITTWTWENGAVLRETNLQTPNYLNILTFNLVNDNESFITAVGPSHKYLYSALCSIKTGEVLHVFKDTTPLYFKNMTRVAIGWCNGERFAAVVNGTPSVFIQNLHKPHVHQIMHNINNVRVISLNAHKTENYLAITDVLGRAIILRGNFFKATDIGREILHWHFLPTIAVSFSMQGSYLYTGGMEKVLVKWTLSHLASNANEKNFIPRLPGMIRFISTNNTHVAAVLANNSIVIANTQMRVVSTILECGGLSPAARALGAPLVYHSQLGGLLLGGRTGHLQLYSTTTDKLLYNIDITGLNNTPPERHNLLPLETEVVCVGISGTGTWLVTSEYRNDGLTYPEERLKFWSMQQKNVSPFKLNTCVNLSHGGCRVLSIALNTKGEVCVTAGDDQKFRIWKRENTTQQHRKKSSWNCITACYYSSGIAQFLSHDILNNYKNCEMPTTSNWYPYLTNFKQENDIVKKIMNIHNENSLMNESMVNPGFRKDVENDMGDVAISRDGSLIAAWFGCKLTLWDTHLCNMRTTLSHPALRSKGVHVKFGNQDAAHYLVCTTKNSVAVWSLLSLTIKWVVQISATCLASDPFSNKIAVVTTNNDVYVFTPHSSTPTLTQKRVMDPETGLFKQCTFGSSSGHDVRLYLMRNDADIFCLEPEKSKKGRLELITHRNLPASNFSALVAEQRLIEVQTAPNAVVQQLDVGALGNSAITQFMSAAPHMVPPVSLICTSFLQHLSGHEQSQESDEPQKEEMEVDQSSDDDIDETLRINRVYTPKPTQLWTPNYEKVKEKRLQKILKEPLLDLHATETIFAV